MEASLKFRVSQLSKIKKNASDTKNYYNPLGVINQNLLLIDFFAGNLYSIRTKMSV